MLALAAERERAVRGESGESGWANADDPLPSREVFVAYNAAYWPSVPVEQWHADYDRLLADQED